MEANPLEQIAHVHLACEAGHQTSLSMRRGTALAYQPGSCTVCELPLHLLGELPEDLYGRRLGMDDTNLPLVPSPAGRPVPDRTPLVVLRNHVAESGFSYLIPDVRRARLDATCVAEIRYLMERGRRTHLLAVVEPSTYGQKVALFEVEGHTNGTWTIGQYRDPEWAAKTYTRALPVGLPPEDLHLFQALETFIREERCHDTSLYTPAAWKRRGDAIRKGAVLTVVSEGASGLVQRHHFGYGFDRAFSQRLDLLLLKHGAVAELDDHLTLHLFRRT